MKKIKEIRGIAIVILIITLIVLFVVLGITIFWLKNSGVFELAKLVKENNQNVEELETSLTADNTNVASTRELEIIDKVYPVGSIYITTSNKNPSETFGGTWESYGQGRTLIGAGEGKDSNNETKTFAVDEKGGEYKHTLTVSELAKHYHWMPNGDSTGSLSVPQYIGGGNVSVINTDIHNMNEGAGYFTGYAGNNKAHNNIQPYIVTYMWKRTK